VAVSGWPQRIDDFVSRPEVLNVPIGEAMGKGAMMGCMMHAHTEPWHRV